MKEQISLMLMVVGSVLFFDVGRAHAGLVTWELAGTVTDVEDPLNVLDGAIGEGSAFSGILTFDSSTPDERPTTPTSGQYLDAVTDLSVAVEEVQFVWDGAANSIHLSDLADPADGFRDWFQLRARLESISPDLTGALLLQLRNRDGTMLADDSLPRTPPAFDLGVLLVEDRTQEVQITGTIETVVPEPTALVLLVAGSLPLFIRLASRRNGSVVALLLIFALSASPPAASAAWSGGPVLIGGDDTDDHFEDEAGDPTGRIYMREGFNFLGPHVGNANTLAVCVGCDAGMEAENNFQKAFDDSTLPGLGWTRTSINGDTAINTFFANTSAVKIDDTGIIHFPSAGEVEGGLDEVEAINNNRAALRSFVKVDRGGLFTHAITDLPVAGGGTEPYLWLEELVPGIVVVESGGNDMYLTCTAKGAFFPDLTSEEVDAIEDAFPWHVHFEENFGGLSVIAESDPPESEAIILGGPLPGSDCNQNAVLDGCELSGNDANGNGIPDECDIEEGTTCDIDGDGIPDEAAACCDGQDGCVNDMPASCVSAGGTPYFGATCGECTCTSAGACCFGATCEFLVECECVALGGVIAQGQPSCFPNNPCTDGACCGGVSPPCFETETGTCNPGYEFQPLGTCNPDTCDELPSVGCPAASFDPAADADPPSGTKDARQPHPLNDNSLAARQGIGSPNTYAGGPEIDIISPGARFWGACPGISVGEAGLEAHSARIASSGLT